MTKRLSCIKSQRVLGLYFEGCSQRAIARRLHIDQSTVSVLVTRYKQSAVEAGFEEAAVETGISDTIEALHDLAVELKRAKLAPEEAMAGLRMHEVLQSCGVAESQYESMIEAWQHMQLQGFTKAAIKLIQLEQRTAKTYEQVTADFTTAASNVAQLQKELEKLKLTRKTMQQEIQDLAKERQTAEASVAKSLKSLGLDMQRLKRVEELATALKKLGVCTSEVEAYLVQQKALHLSGLSLDVLLQVIDRTKIETQADQGHDLLQKLKEFGDLATVIGTQQTKVKLLSQEAADLEQKVALKKNLQKDIGQLKAAKASFEKDVAGLAEQTQHKNQLQQDVSRWTEVKTELEKRVQDLKTERRILEGTVQERKKTAENLAGLEPRYQKATADLSQLEAGVAQRSREFELFQSFLGFVGASSLEEVQTFAAVVPSLVALAHEKKYSPIFLIRHILGGLSQEKLKLMCCGDCACRFLADMPPKERIFGYTCPACHSRLYVTVDQDAASILRQAVKGAKGTPLLVSGSELPKNVSYKAIPRSVSDADGNRLDRNLKGRFQIE